MVGNGHLDVSPLATDRYSPADPPCTLAEETYDHCHCTQLHRVLDRTIGGISVKVSRILCQRRPMTTVTVTMICLYIPLPLPCVHLAVTWTLALTCDPIHLNITLSIILSFPCCQSQGASTLSPDIDIEEPLIPDDEELNSMLSWLNEA